MEIAEDKWNVWLMLHWEQQATNHAKPITTTCMLFMNTFNYGTAHWWWYQQARDTTDICTP